MKKNKAEDDYDKYLYQSFTFGKKIKRRADIRDISQEIQPAYTPSPQQNLE